MNIKKLKELSVLLFHNLLGCIEKAAVVRVLLFGNKSYDDKSEGWKITYLHMRMSLFNDFITSLHNLISDPRKSHISYRKLFEMVNNPNEKDILRTEYLDVAKKPNFVIDISDPKIVEMIRKKRKDEISADAINRFEVLYLRVSNNGKLLLDQNNEIVNKIFSIFII